MPERALPAVVCFATGGTIASTYDPDSRGHLPTIDGAELVAAAPELESLAAVEVVELAQIDCTSFAPQQVLDWSRAILSRLAQPEVDGAVVLQGTNTLDQCAYLLDLALPHGRREVEKTHTSALRAFSSPGLGALRYGDLGVLRSCFGVGNGDAGPGG